MEIKEKKYSVTQIPRGQEGKFLRLCRLDPDLFAQDVEFLRVRQAMGEARGRTPVEVAGFQASVINTVFGGNSQRIMAITPTNKDGDYIPELTVRIRSLENEI